MNIDVMFGGEQCPGFVEAFALIPAPRSEDCLRAVAPPHAPELEPLRDQTFPAGHLQRPERTGALCTPLGGGVPVGFLYVESSTWIAADDRERLETIAQHLGSIHVAISDRAQPPLRAQLRALQERLIREALERHRGNIAEVARELAVGRTLVYRTLKRRCKPQ